MVRGAAVIPGTHVFPLEEDAAYVLAEEDAGHIDQPPLEKGGVFHPLHDGSEESGAAVDREHPEGGFSCQFQVAYAERMQSGPEDLHRPAKHPASKKVLSYHTRQYGDFSENYACSFAQVL